MARFLNGDWGTGLLLEYVFLEVVNVLLVRRDLETAVRLGRILLEAKELDFVPCSEIFLNTVGEFSAQVGTKLSFVDCAIASVAWRRAEGKILPFDGELLRLCGTRL